MFVRCENIGLREKNANALNTISELRKQLDGCIHAPEEIVVIRDTVILRSKSKPVKPKPINGGPPANSGSQGVDEDECSSNFYSDRFNLTDSIYADWRAKTTGTIDSFEIFAIGYPKRTTIITRSVPNITDDSIARLLSSVRERNTIWLYLRPSAVIDFKTPEGLSAGAIWLNKHKWGLGVGAGWSFTRNKPTVEAILLFNLM